jgi:hypothetical protein
LTEVEEIRTAELIRSRFTKPDRIRIPSDVDDWHRWVYGGFAVFRGTSKIELQTAKNANKPPLVRSEAVIKAAPQFIAPSAANRPIFKPITKRGEIIAYQMELPLVWELDIAA